MQLLPVACSTFQNSIKSAFGLIFLLLFDSQSHSVNRYLFIFLLIHSLLFSIILQFPGILIVIYTRSYHFLIYSTPRIDYIYLNLIVQSTRENLNFPSPLILGCVISKFNLIDLMHQY